LPIVFTLKVLAKNVNSLIFMYMKKDTPRANHKLETRGGKNKVEERKDEERK
jgi:hypothetical protein